MILIGTGSAVPDFTLTNQRLESMVDTSDEWIVKRTGIRERRIAKGKATWEIALEAAQNALADAGLDPLALDLIITGTVTPDFFTPSVACMVQGKLGAKNAFAFDLNAACSGFVYAADVADSFIRSGKAKNVRGDAQPNHQLSGSFDLRDLRRRRGRGGLSGVGY